MARGSSDVARVAGGVGAVAGVTLIYVKWLHVSNAATVSTTFLLVVLVVAATSRLWIAIVTSLVAMLPSAADRDLAHRLVRTLTQHHERPTLREGDVYAIALRHLEKDLRSGDAAVMDSIQREVSLRETVPKTPESL